MTKSIVIDVYISNVSFADAENKVDRPVPRSEFIKNAPMRQRLMIGQDESLSDIMNTALRVLSSHSQYDYMSADLESIEAII